MEKLFDVVHHKLGHAVDGPFRSLDNAAAQADLMNQQLQRRGEPARYVARVRA